MMIIDENAWYQAWLDTPLNMKRRPDSPEEAMTLEGCAVKSREREGGWPKHHGKLVTYGDEVIVRGYGDAVSPKFVWRGTRADYFRVWECD